MVQVILLSLANSNGNKAIIRDVKPSKENDHRARVRVTEFLDFVNANFFVDKFYIYVKLR